MAKIDYPYHNARKARTYERAHQSHRWCRGHATGIDPELLAAGYALLQIMGIASG